MNVPFGGWPSPIDASALTRGIKGFADLQHAAGQLFLLESRPEEAGRTTLLMIDPSTPNATPVELTPAPLNVRSRVHEYGGGAFLAEDSQVVFVNFADQNLYRVELAHTAEGILPSAPQAITQSDANTRFADFTLDLTQSRVIAVCEQHTEGNHEPQNLLVAVDLPNGDPASAPSSPITLHEGHDFYAAPRVSPDGSQIAFVIWDHPNMPWDATALMLAPLVTQGPLMPEVAAGGPHESVTQPHWYANCGDEPDRLGFVSDRSGFWNLYVTTDDGHHCLHNDEAEYASPAWVFGQRESVVLTHNKMLTARAHNGAGSLCVIDSSAASGLRCLDDQFASYTALCADGNTGWCIADRVDGFACVLEIDLESGTSDVLLEAGSFGLPAVSTPQALRIDNRDGETTYAWFYPPLALTDTLPAGENQSDTAADVPPLLVLSHGGPTSACNPALNLRIQYYTSRGWAVADVNYAGSAGYGRKYRERLRNQWGIADVADCEDIALHLCAAGKVDPDRLAIKGGSAGGYTTLAALTFGDVFAAGASHYGIGDLNALAADTHKFEARYIDGLVPADQWSARSPITSVDSLSCPVIFFQGADDAVVPPNQAQAMVAALQNKNLPVAYVEFAGEGHGFRQAANIQHAARAEYQFFCTVFGIQCPDAPIDLHIENLA